ncbi:MAG: flippase-like domain-containing protein [Myxococcales bacterium]|nr:flippase-like domain-containing protein [Myxococcales bacterium]
MSEPVDQDATPEAIGRFRRWAAVAVALAVLGYVAYAVWKGWSETSAQLVGFSWPLYVPVLALTAVNYGLRYFKWAYFLSVLGIRVPHRTNGWIFASGLAMVISPAKAGEVVKPWMVRQTAGAPYTRTIPALIAERGTDGLAVVILAAFSVSTYYAEATSLIFGTLAAILAIVGAIAVRPVAVGLIGLVGRIPPLAGLSHRLLDTYEATRACLAPVPFLVTMVASLVAWGAECVGYWLVFRGLGVDAPLDACTFLYAFATVFGAPSPGGMGIADAALAEGAVAVLDGVDAPTALAASLLIRVATLWFGVALGAVALLRTETVIDEARAARS